METKTKAIIIAISVFIILIIIAGIILGGYAIIKNNVDKKNSNISNPTIRLLIGAVDAETNQRIDGEYSVWMNYSIISEGKLNRNIYTEVSLPLNQTPIINCWGENYYLTKIPYYVTQEDIQLNITQETCSLYKSSNIKVDVDGSIKNKLNSISIKINSPKWYYKTGFCFAWTAGIIDVIAPNQIVSCTSGWKNYSSYDEKTKNYVWLLDNTYVCNQNNYEKCERVFENSTQCKLFSEIIPQRFAGKVDSCIYTGRTLHNETGEFNFVVKTLDNKNALDKLRIFVYDKDRRYIPEKNDWIWMSEYNGKNLGAEDINYTIYYDDNLRIE